MLAAWCAGRRWCADQEAPLTGISPQLLADELSQLPAARQELLDAILEALMTLIRESKFQKSETFRPQVRVWGWLATCVPVCCERCGSPLMVQPKLLIDSCYLQLHMQPLCEARTANAKLCSSSRLPAFAEAHGWDASQAYNCFAISNHGVPSMLMPAYPAKPAFGRP